jgi:hypothetical protein
VFGLGRCNFFLISLPNHIPEAGASGSVKRGISNSFDSSSRDGGWKKKKGDRVFALLPQHSSPFCSPEAGQAAVSNKASFPARLIEAETRAGRRKAMTSIYLLSRSSDVLSFRTILLQEQAAVAKEVVYAR